MTETKPIVILGSARRKSDTRLCVDRVFNTSEIDIFDLLDFNITQYNYEGNYPLDDDFDTVISEMLKHKKVVFATPVYWYSMSGPMKILFDRFTDLVTIKKEMGRQLKGISVFLISVGLDPELPEGFEIPFKLTANYLDMNYGGNIYFSTEKLFPETFRKAEIREFKEFILTTM